MKSMQWIGAGLLLVLCMGANAPCFGAEIEATRLTSPDQSIAVTVDVGETLAYSVSVGGKTVLAPSKLSMTLSGNQVLGLKGELKKVTRRAVDELLRPVVKVKSETIRDQFNEMTLTFAGGYAVVFRAYDDAVAYRFVTERNGEMTVTDEQLEYRFADDYGLLFPEEDSMMTHQERLYVKTKLSDVSSDRFCSLPVLIEANGGPKMLITEADLLDYPGFYMKGAGGAAFEAQFPPVALEEDQKNDRDVAVSKTADYLAKTAGPRAFPWRVLIIAREDKDLLTNQTVYKLASPCELTDTSWIKPGRVAWDWWNYNNIYGVDFRAGVNTETYKYYIDFAADHGIEYIILDEGWYVLGDLLDISPGMDVEELFAYGKKKNVGIILWVVWKTLEDQMTEALDQFEKWGAKGIKVDFMQRDDQWMVNYYRRVAEEGAKRKLLVDFHGSYKPSGLRRMYPNVITREGVKGLENCKWSEDITPEHCVTLPFTRMVAGPMDFTPGAMVNAQPENFNAVFNRPMSMGTRCHQLGMYVIYESPLQMLADNPSNYLRETETMEFLSVVPTVWDESHALEAKVGDYVVMARRSGKEWYLGAMTDATARAFDLPLSFLGAGSYTAHIYQDGINADRYGSDYQKVTKTVTSKDTLKAVLATGGGWVARLVPVQ